MAKRNVTSAGHNHKENSQLPWAEERQNPTTVSGNVEPRPKTGSDKDARAQLKTMAIAKAWCGNWAVFRDFYVYVMSKLLKDRTAEGAIG